MKDRPILFSGPMVRAILEGRKTQTRRLIKFEWSGSRESLMHQSTFDPAYKCPYGQPGDRLWVKETHWRQKWLGEASRVRYRADDMMRVGPNQFEQAMAKEPKWLPSIFMPRWASRLILEIVSVRVERLNDISASDCKAEGIQIPRCGCEVCATQSIICTADAGEYVMAYRELWESINGLGSWATNPYVWVIEFKEVKP